MERRKFVVGLGSLAAGGAAAIGTGAYSSGTVSGREASIEVVNDDNGLIGLHAGSQTDLVYQNGAGKLTIDLSRAMGEGVNPDSKFYIGEENTFPPAFSVVNQGSQDVELKVEYELEDPTAAGDSLLELYSVMNYDDANKGPNRTTATQSSPTASHRSDDASLDRSAHNPNVAPGDAMQLSLGIDAADVGDDLSGTITVEADKDPSNLS